MLRLREKMERIITIYCIYLLYTINEKIGGKWSMKYKRSINCKKPRGFSQKQYCKYGRKTLTSKKLSYTIRNIK